MGSAWHALRISLLLLMAVNHGDSGLGFAARAVLFTLEHVASKSTIDGGFGAGRIERYPVECGHGATRQHGPVGDAAQRDADIREAIAVAPRGQRQRDDGEIAVSAGDLVEVMHRGRAGHRAPL